MISPQHNHLYLLEEKQSASQLLRDRDTECITQVFHTEQQVFFVIYCFSHTSIVAVS